MLAICAANVLVLITWFPMPMLIVPSTLGNVWQRALVIDNISHNAAAEIDGLIHLGA
jgi:hypothetical protein